MHRRRVAVAVLTAAALGTALVAPLATGTGSAGAVTIDGARSLSDTVSVQFKKPKDKTTDVHVLAFNDLHGTLDPAGNNIYGKFAGGAAFLAKAVKDKQALYGDDELTVFAGDNIGASPLASALFHDEPITVATNLMNVDFGSVGNHEFDEGKDELLRMQKGGCHPTDGCAAAPYTLANGTTTDEYPGADFQYLSANVVVDATGKTLFPAFGTKRFKSDSGKKFEIGVIGEVLKETPTIVTPTGVAGLDFVDEADQANAAIKALRKQGREHERVGDPPGRLPAVAGRVERMRRQLGRQRHPEDRPAPRPVHQGDRVRPHPRGVPLHDHDVRRRHPAHHQRVIVRPDPDGRHTDHR